MKISKKSWHYRLLRSGVNSDERIPANLCGYCWFLLYAVSLISLAAVMGIAAIVAICYLIYRFFTWDGLTLFVQVTMGTVVLFAIICLIVAWHQHKKNHPGPQTLAGKWLKAKKDKICPLIEWTDE